MGGDTIFLNWRQPSPPFGKPHRRPRSVSGRARGTTLSSFTYTDNDENLRTACTEADGSVVSYGYDGAGRLTSESRTGTNPYVRTYVVDGVGNRLSQTVGGVTTAVYTYGNGLVRKDGEYPLYDGLGSERTVPNSSQSVTGTSTYEGFGQTVASTGSSTNPYKFAGVWGYREDGNMEMEALIKTLYPFGGGPPTLGGGAHGGNLGVGVGAGGYFGIGIHVNIKLFNLKSIWRWVRKYIG